MKKLYKSEKDKVLFGVCGGFAEYFGFDVTILRIVWACTVLLVGTGFLAYLICAIIMPKKPHFLGDGNVYDA